MFSPIERSCTTSNYCWCSLVLACQSRCSRYRSPSLSLCGASSSQPEFTLKTRATHIFILDRVSLLCFFFCTNKNSPSRACVKAKSMCCNRYSVNIQANSLSIFFYRFPCFEAMEFSIHYSSFSSLRFFLARTRASTDHAYDDVCCRRNVLNDV